MNDGNDAGLGNILVLPIYILGIRSQEIYKSGISAQQAGPSIVQNKYRQKDQKKVCLKK